MRPRNLKGPTNERVLRVAQRLRLGVASGFSITFLFVPLLPLTERLALSALTLGYAISSYVLEEIGARHPGFPAGIVTPLLGIATIFTVTMVLPGVMAASLFFYVLGIVFYTCVSGMTIGLVLAAVVMPVSVAANQLVPPEDAVNGFTLLMFVLVLPSVAVTIEMLTQERRRTAAKLARLHDALQAVTVTPDLDATLDSIVESASDAIGAAATGILLREQDHLVVAAPSGATDGFTETDLTYYTGREVAMGDESPLTRSMQRLEPVVVGDVRSSSEFPRWSKLWGKTLHRGGFASLVSVPLHTGSKVIGVLNAVFERHGGLAGDELALLQTYAEQVSLVIARSQAYERERQAAEQLAETDRLRSEFLSMVSHELRTPLTVVKGFTDTMVTHWDGLPDERRRELLTRVSSNADELARLVNQLLDFARMDAGQVRLSPAATPLHRIVESILGDVAPIMAGHVVRVSMEPDFMVLADPDAVGHVMVNLLTNAVRFSPAGSEIEIAAVVDGPHLVVSVADHGVGIPPAEVGHVFERFYQANNGDGPRRGTGIGLTIARHFTELQGGRIWVESELGVGSTFFFTLPAVVAEPAAPTPAPEAPPTRSEPVTA